MSNFQQRSFISLIFFGSIFICVGAIIFLISINVISVPEEDINAPRWVIAAVGLAFALAGGIVMVNGLKSGFGDHILFKWIYNGMLLLFILLFAIPFNWVAFGSGERSFSSSTSIGIGPISQSSTGETSGRLVFGFGAILIDIFVLFIIFRIVQGKNLSKDE